MSNDHHPGTYGRERHYAVANGHHNPLGVGEDTDANGDSPQQKQLLYCCYGKQIADAEIGERMGGDEHAHDIADVVRTKAVEPNAPARISPRRV